jgi:hypothetical protein
MKACLLEPWIECVRGASPDGRVGVDEGRDLDPAQLETTIATREQRGLGVANEVAAERFVCDQPAYEHFDNPLRHGDRLSRRALGKFQTAPPALAAYATPA